MSIDLMVLRQVETGKPWAFCVWEPQSPMVVLGRSGDIKKEVNQETCVKDRVPVFQRRTGGGAVVLSPGVLVFSFAKIVEKPLVIREYTEMSNALVADFLAMQGIGPVKSLGISDLCIGKRKIMGSGMFRRGKLLFFQGSILVNNDISLMSRYLKHPPREPGYRMGRAHEDFATTLSKEGYSLSAEEMIPHFVQHLKARIEEIR